MGNIHCHLPSTIEGHTEPYRRVTLLFSGDTQSSGYDGDRERECRADKGLREDQHVYDSNLPLVPCESTRSICCRR